MEPHQGILPHGSWLADLDSPPILKAGWGLPFNKDLDMAVEWRLDPLVINWEADIKKTFKLQFQQALKSF